MAYTQVAASPPTLTGTVQTFPACEVGGTAVRPGTTVVFKNGATPATVTINVGRTYNGYAITPPQVVVGAGATIVVGPIPADPFVQTTGVNSGWVLLDYTNVTTITRLVTT